MDSEPFFDYWLVGDDPYLHLGDIVEIEYKREEGDIPTFDYAVATYKFDGDNTGEAFLIVGGEDSGRQFDYDVIASRAKKFVRVSAEFAKQKSVVGSDGLNETEREYMAREYDERMRKPLSPAAKQARMDYLERKMKEKND